MSTHYRPKVSGDGADYRAADRRAPRTVSDAISGHGAMLVSHQTMTFAYTLPDGRTFVTPHQVLLDYTMAHDVGDQVLLRVNPLQPRQFEVYDKEFAGKGFAAGAVGMILAVGAAVSFWLAYDGLLQRARPAPARRCPARRRGCGGSICAVRDRACPAARPRGGSMPPEAALGFRQARSAQRRHRWGRCSG